MKNINLLSLLLVWMAATAAVQAQSLTLGYCNGEVSTKTSWGGSGNGNTSAAIFVPSATLSGMSGAQISTISVGLSTRLNIDELTVWVRTSLTGENVAEGVLNRKETRVQQGWNEVSLNTPYPIDGSDLYIGYTYHHTSLANAVSVVGTTPAGTAFFKQTDSSQWQDLSSEGAISIEAAVSGGSLAAYDLSLSSLSLTPYLSAGPTAYKATLQVQNLGTQTVGGFSVTLQADGISPATAHISQTIASGRQEQVSCIFSNLDGNISREGTIKATISGIDGSTDENADNNTTEGTLSFERNVLLEEFTTELCPNCPTGAETMRTALASRPEFAQRVAVVAHHSAFGTDWLTQPCDEDYTWMFNEGGQVYAPSWMIDRQGEFETNLVSGGRQAIFFTSDYKILASVVDAALQQPTHVVLGVQPSIEQNKVSITVIGLRDESYSLANGRLTVYLIEDGIAARSQQGLNGVEQGYIHEHVIRAYNSSWGDAIDWQGAAFATTLQFDLDPAWNTDKMQVIAFVANYDAANNLNCTVENTVAIPVVTKVDTGIRDNNRETMNNNRETITNNRFVYDLAGRRTSGAARGLRIVDGKKISR